MLDQFRRQQSLLIFVNLNQNQHSMENNKISSSTMNTMMIMTTMMITMMMTVLIGITMDL
ncbi:hypothetical protein BD408DRAFT_422927 [Parasitella parasitica]|nr:hypothetical protein BD408DRAFT_422927 [Parasitella parasitica]